MQIDSKTLLCQYLYDALDRLVASAPSAQVDTRRFYLKDRLATEIQGAVQRSIMQHEDQLLAQQQRQSGTVETRLLATDQQRSVLNVLAAARRNPLAYTPYGHRHPENSLLSLLGFNGERPDSVTGHYLLGNGYRAFNPVLMRFNSPDSWSPFGEGGLNGYAYCSGDPRNRSDPSGHAFSFIEWFGSLTKKNSFPLKAINTIDYELKGGPLRDKKRISANILTYTDTYKGEPRLNIDAHGIDTPRFKSSRISSEGKLLDAQGLYETVQKKNINFSDYNNIRLVVCNSANGGSGSIAANLSTLTGIPVKGYLGSLMGVKNLEFLLDNGLNDANRARIQSRPPLPPLVANAVSKSNPYIAIRFIRGVPQQ